VKGIDNLFTFFTGIIEQFQIGRVVDILRGTSGINQQFAFVFCPGTWRIIIFVGIFLLFLFYL